MTLLPPKNTVFFPTGMHLPVGNSFDVRKVIGSSPISSTKPNRKVGLFLLSSGKPLAVGQVIGSSPRLSAKKNPIHLDGFSFLVWYSDIGLEKGGLAKQGKKVSGGHFFSPRKSPMGAWAQSAGLWTHGHPSPPLNPLSSGKPLAVGQVMILPKMPPRLPGAASLVPGITWLRTGR